MKKLILILLALTVPLRAADLTLSADIDALLASANYATARTNLGVSLTSTYVGYGSSGAITGEAAFTYDPTTNTLTIENISSSGTFTIANLNATTLNLGSQVFEGATADAFETTLTVVDPTGDRSISLPDATDTLVGKATTDTLTNKTLDASGTGNVVKLKGEIQLTHPHLVDGTGATIATTATGLTYGHATFSNSADKAANYAEYYITVPGDIDTSVALRARLKVLLSGGADTGDQNWLISSVSVADSAVLASSTLANEIALDYTADASGASGDIETTAWTTLTGWAAALTAGQTWRIRLMRDGDTSDASTVNSTELGLVIEYGISQ